jgi:hypothetical protein
MGAKVGDLHRLVSNKVHIDEYSSKLGPGHDVVTVSFKIKQKLPAQDLVAYLENGYDWVLDADISTGEIVDGEYLVFLEIPRRKNLFERLQELFSDLRYLTGIKPEQIICKWYKEPNYWKFNKDNFKKFVPDTPVKYNVYIENIANVEESIDNLQSILSEIKG